MRKGLSPRGARPIEQPPDDLGEGPAVVDAASTGTGGGSMHLPLSTSQ